VSRRRSATAVLLAAVVLAAAPACASDPPAIDDGVLHAVMLGTDEVLDERSSDAVDAIGLRLRALGPSLAAVLETPAGGEAALEALDTFDKDVTALTDAVAVAPPPVRQGFAGYVEGWQAIATSERVRLTTTDPARATAATEVTAAEVARLQALDAERVARVVAAFGEEEAARLLGLETSAPA
jgi:hypothetical protein